VRVVHRVLVAGISGSGKTTFARELAARTGLTFHEMDALYHGPGWVPLESFDSDVERISAADRWVFDSHGYEQVRDLVWSRADTVVWLSYPRVVVMSRVLRRSFRRAWKRDEIFNGNTETFTDWLDPEHPVRWAWTQYEARRQDIESRFADPAYAHVRKVRLVGPFAARRWLDTVCPEPARPEAS
jgi:adenylate kinase family enzyme